jgi:hypothetical protein
MRLYFYHLGIAIDQLINAVFGGWPDQTISARAYTNRLELKWAIAMFLIDLFFSLFGDNSHCLNAHEEEKKRLQSPLEERKPND